MDKMKMAEKEVLLWAKRTVFFAITLRAEDDSQFVDDKKQSGHATRAAQRVVAELWEELAKEAPADAPHKIFVFARKVLDWCEEHRRRD